MIRYSISVRAKPFGMGIGLFLAEHFPEVQHSSVDSVFGFVERSTLYGGRPFFQPELTDGDMKVLKWMGVKLRLPLTNKFVTRAEYAENGAFLDRYHREGNAVIVANDDLAHWVRADFPKYRIEASAIKDLRTHDRIAKAFELYDRVILPAAANDDLAFLEAVERKEAVTLFANAGCAYNCPARICYTYISNMNKYNGAGFRCSKEIEPRPELGVIEFDVKRLSEMGFTHFKLLRSNGKTGF